MTDTPPEESSDVATGFESGWRARFDRFASRGGSPAKISGWSEEGLQHRLEAVLTAIDEHPPEAEGPFLDLGCGSGIYSRRLLERGRLALGADYSLGMLRRAREWLDDAPVPLVAADVLSLPFRNRSFAGLINVGVLQHIADARGALEEMARVLRPGGRAYVVTLNRRSIQAAILGCRDRWVAWKSGRWRPQRHAVRRSVGDLVRLGRVNGLEPVAIRGVYLMPRGTRWSEGTLRRMDRSVLGGLVRPLANAFLVILQQQKK